MAQAGEEQHAMRLPPATLCTFTYFPHLPSEIRLKIWEESWPEPRVIEVAYYFTSDEYAGLVCLRPTCVLSTWLKNNFSSRAPDEEEPIEQCIDPVALHICQESRTHTIRRFICMQHLELDNHAFYFNPRSDILWLNIDALEDTCMLDRLEEQYSEQLNRIERALVGEQDWDSPMYTSEFLDTFEGLRVVQILLDTYEGPDDLFSDDPGPPITAKQFLETANDFVTRDIPALRGRNWTVQYMDRMYNIYREFEVERSQNVSP